MAIYDVMHQVQPDVATICVGSAGGMAALLLAGGGKGMRYALPSAEVGFCPSVIGASAPDEEPRFLAQELRYCTQRWNQLMAMSTGQSEERVERDTRERFFLSAPEAIAYGIIDKIVER